MPSRQRSYQISTLAIACLGLFLVLLDSTIVIIALPHIRGSLDASMSGLQWVVDAYTLPFAVLLLLAGTLGDRFGRKKTFLGGLFVFTVGSVLCGLASDLLWLNVGRAVQGVGGAAMATGGMALVVSAFTTREERTKAVGLYSALGGIALSIGPMLGGALVDSLDWRWIFYVNIPFTVLGMIFGAWLLRDSRNPDAGKIDGLGQVVAIVGLSLLTYALIEGNNKHWGSPLIVGCLVGAGLSLATFVLVQARTTQPMVPLDLFRQRVFSAANLAILVVGFALIGAAFFFAQFFQIVQGSSAFLSGVDLLPMTLAMFFCAPLSTWLAAKVGFRVPVLVGSLLAGGSLVSFVILQPDSSYALLVWPLTAFGIGFGLLLAPLVAAVITAVPPWRAGLASGINNTSRQVGAVFGVAVLGTIVEHLFTTHLTSKLAALPLPPGAAGSIVTQLTERGNSTPPADAPPFIVEQITQAANEAYTDGLRTAFLVAGIVMLAVVPLCALLLRTRTVVTSTVVTSTIEPTGTAEPPADAQPAGALPLDAKVAETTAAVADPIVAEPAVTEPAVTEPAMTEPAVAQPAVAVTEETPAVETKQAALVTGH